MSALSQLKEANDVESTEDRLLAAYARLPRPGRCKFIDENGVVCQRRRRVGGAWCDVCLQRVTRRP
jgi:hypothetical protein